jgi:hypothetical protein
LLARSVAGGARHGRAPLGLEAERDRRGIGRDDDGEDEDQDGDAEGGAQQDVPEVPDPRVGAVRCLVPGLDDLAQQQALVRSRTHLHEPARCLPHRVVPVQGHLGTAEGHRDLGLDLDVVVQPHQLGLGLVGLAERRLDTRTAPPAPEGAVLGIVPLRRARGLQDEVLDARADGCPFGLGGTVRGWAVPDHLHAHPERRGGALDLLRPAPPAGTVEPVAPGTAGRR